MRPKHSQIEFYALPQPIGMVRVVFKMITSEAMNKDGEAFSIGVQPWDESIEMLCTKGCLAAPFRMWPY